MAPPPVARLCHTTPGRARLRFAREMSDAQRFERIGQVLAQHADVHEVRVNARTGSVLLLHGAALVPILEFAREKELFTVDRQVERTPMRRIQASLDDMDRRLARETHGAFSVGTATFLGLVAAGLYQLKQGKFLPAGMTLFTYALQLMQREAGRESSGSPESAQNVAGV